MRINKKEAKIILHWIDLVEEEYGEDFYGEELKLIEKSKKAGKMSEKDKKNPFRKLYKKLRRMGKRHGFKVMSIHNIPHEEGGKIDIKIEW